MTLPSQPILGLIDGMEVLQLLAASPTEMSGVDISQTLGIEKTKVNRILKTLAFQGFASVTAGRKYRLGPAIHILSAQILHGSGLIKNAMKHLEELTKLDVVVAMGVLWRDKVAYTYHWTPGISAAEGIGRMGLFPATQSSIGMQLLSEKSDEEIKTIINTEVSIQGFDSEHCFWTSINDCRTNKIAQNTFEGNASIAVSLGEPAYAGLALAQHSKTKNLNEHIAVLKEKASLIEKATSKI